MLPFGINELPHFQAEDPFQVQQQLDAGTAILVNDAHTERCTIQPADQLSGLPDSRRLPG